MARTIQDHDLLLWEAYTAAGAFGFPDRSKLVFHCLTDPGRRARVLQRDADLSEVTAEVNTLSEAELLVLLGRAERVD
jgi:hypothetical protein